MILIFIAYTLIWYGIDYWILPFFGENYTPTTAFKFWKFVAFIFYLFIECNLIAFGFQYFQRTIRFEKRLRIMQNEKLEIEYAFLRAQINPHFLNNTLNFFYAKSLPLSQELSNSIMTLSEIMRYSLQMDQNKQLMPLSQEIEHVQNVININQLRFNHTLNLDLTVIGEIHSVLIVPLTIVTVVENILNHGDCKNPDFKAKIVVTIDPDNNFELFSTNKKKYSKTESSIGIGLQNLKKRLKNYYGNNFQLDVNDQNDFYTLSLKILNKTL